MPTWAKPTACSTFAKRNTRPSAGRSDVDAEVGRLKDHDVLDVQEMPQEHLHDHAPHVDEEEARDGEPRPSPAAHEVGEVRALHRATEPVETREADDEEADHEQRADDGRHHGIPHAEEVREVDVGEGLDLVRVPALPEP